MTFSSPVPRATIAIDVLAFLICCAGIVQIIQKPGLGIDLKAEHNRVFCTDINNPSAKTSFVVGDCLSTLAGQQIHHVEDVEFLLDGRKVGDSVLCTIERAGGSSTAPIVLIDYYGIPYIVIVILVSGLFFFVGVFVSVRKPGDSAAQVYHLGSIGTAIFPQSRHAERWIITCTGQGSSSSTRIANRFFRASYPDRGPPHAPHVLPG